MAHADISRRPGFGQTHILTAPFRALGRLIERIDRNDPRLIEVRRLHTMTDAELAARGTDRTREIRRIFNIGGL